MSLKWLLCSGWLYARELRPRERWSRQRLLTHQNAALRRLLRHAVARSSFYRDLCRGVDLERVPLSDLPPVDKRTLMAHFDEAVTDPRLRLPELKQHLEAAGADDLYLGKYVVLSTSGSSGVRGVFPYPRRAVALYLAQGLRAMAMVPDRPAVAGPGTDGRAPSGRPSHAGGGGRGADAGDGRGGRMKCCTCRAGPARRSHCRPARSGGRGGRQPGSSLVIPPSTSEGMCQAMERVLLFGGAYNLAFALFHLCFWRLFNWRQDLASLRFINRQVMQVLNLCLTFAFLIFAYISFFHTAELVGTGLGRSLLLLISVFWLLRSVEQVLFFRLKHWVSAALFVTFLVGALLYGYPWLEGR